MHEEEQFEADIVTFDLYDVRISVAYVSKYPWLFVDAVTNLKIRILFVRVEGVEY